MLYVMGGDEGPLKIGRALRPKSRLHSVQTGSPRLIRLLFEAQAPDGLDAEAEALAHMALRESWVSGEWFAVPLDTARSAINEAIHAAARGERAFGKSMGRKPLGGTGEKTVMKPMRWAPALLARVDEARGDRDRSEWVREAVTEKLERENKP